MVGEFASVLPDYHTPDIMNLIISYLPHNEDGSLAIITDPQLDSSRHRDLVVSLVKCLQAVADSTHSATLETTLPESLLSSLSKLLDINDPGQLPSSSSSSSHCHVKRFTLSAAAIQLRVLVLWQAMVDHHENIQHLPLHT